MPKMADAVDGLARTDCSSCIQFDAARRSGPVETTVTTWSRPVAYSVGGGGGEVPNELKRRPLLLVVVVLGVPGGGGADGGACSE